MNTEFTAGLARATEKGIMSPGETVTVGDTIMSAELADFFPGSSKDALMVCVTGSLFVYPSFTINCST